MRPWALYVRRLCLCAWLTWMCEMMRFSVSRPFTCSDHTCIQVCCNDCAFVAMTGHWGTAVSLLLEPPSGGNLSISNN